MKALKIVYGFHDDTRAQAELKALDRVKALRHPFLLNLERIEVYEGQLVVVTELADKSMADLFNEHILAGDAGIPREKILQYVRDSGDALDYMSDEHRLQHLDIKPENLLIVSGHVKVADFGLIKDLHNASQSLMQGMTPAYAAPELFDGRPGRRSDQYSLAIVYQEMLTGARPFSGSTPAQLAAQHMHGKPSLRALPNSDQAIIAKALAKDPEHRFSSCREMAEELISRRRIKKKLVTRVRNTRPDSDTQVQTVGGYSTVNDFTAILTQDGLPYQASEIKPSDPPECSVDDAVFRPTLIIGVGNTANSIVRKLKQQMTTRYGSLDSIPSLKLLCIDSDRNELMGGNSAVDGPILESREMLPIPLRKPEAYRDQSDSFKWLSRRWIYNVPRSLQTEGLRPLGRLAFADHFETIWSQLATTIEGLQSPEELAESCRTLEMNPGDIQQPRIILLSTISGGLGSGMTLDLAYTLRLLLAEKGIKTDSLTAILMHAAYRRNRDPGLAAANAIAFLTELRHFNDHGYKGDEGLGIPEFENQSPFDFTYFRDLGRDLNQSDFDERLGDVAEYVGLNAISNCGVFFDACRDKEKDLEHFALRSFGISVSGPGVHGLGEMAVNRLSRGLLSRWIFGTSESNQESVSVVENTFKKFNLSYQTIFESIQRQADLLITNDLLASSCDSIVAGVEKHPASPELALSNGLKGIFGPLLESEAGESEDSENSLAMDRFISKEAISGGDELSNDFVQLLEGETLNLGLIENVVSISQEMLGKWSLELGQELLEDSQELDAVFGEIGTRARKRQYKEAAALIKHYLKLRKEVFVKQYAKEFIRILNRSLNSTVSLTNKFKNHLQVVAGEFPKVADLSRLDCDAGFSVDCLMKDAVDRDLENQITRTEIQIYNSLIKDRGGYTESLNQTSVWQHRLPSVIRNAAQSILTDAYQKLCLDDIIVDQRVAPEQLINWLNQKVAGAMPEMNNCGGAMRLMLGLPRFSTADAVLHLMEHHFHTKQKAINGTCGNFVICFECEDVSLASVAFRLLEDRPDAVELVKRLHTRNDIEWSSLADLL